MVETIGTIKQVYAAYEFLQMVIENESDLKMNVDSKSDNEIVFTPIERPWCTRIFSTAPNYCITDWSKPRRFKEIVIQCHIKRIYQDFLTHFHGKSKISQKEIIDFLKLYYENSDLKPEQISITEECVEKGWGIIPAGDDRGYAEHFDWYALKLTYTIKSSG